MFRHQVEHALRAAQDITGQREFIIIGTGSIFAWFPNPPAPLTVTQEVDIYPRYAPAAGNLLNAIGRYSIFHDTHRFWIDPVSPETAKLPTGWEDRLVKLSNENTSGAIGWCLEVNDLAVSKLIAGREKDCSFVEDLFRHKLVSYETVKGRLPTVPELPPEVLVVAQQRLENVHLQGTAEEVLKTIRRTRPSRDKQPTKDHGVEIGDD